MSNKEKLLTIRKIISHSAFEKVRVGILFLPAIIFFSVFVLLLGADEAIQKETQKKSINPAIFTDFRPGAYPVLASSLSQQYIYSSLSAQGAIIMDSDSKVVLYEKNPDMVFSMASTTKIMTALVALDYYRPDAVLTIQSTNVPPAIVGYSVGEKVVFSDLLYGMMLPSGNDAALAIAQNYHGGGESTFIQAMNEKANAMLLSHTHFSDSSGLDDGGDYTTVRDLARLASLALKNKTLAKVVGTKQQLTTNVTNTKQYPLTNINELLGKYGVIGMKTGFTPEAGGILVTATVQKGHTIIVVVMKSDDRFGDSEKLLSLLEKDITYVSMLP